MNLPKLPLCDEEFFDRFFRKHAMALRNFLYFRYGDADRADDVTQEAFIKLWENCTKVTIDTAKAYLFKIAGNLTISAQRAEKVRIKYRERTMTVGKDHESPEFLALEKEYMEKLTTAIGALPDKQREAFLLNRVEKLTYRESAEMMGVSVKAIEKLMHKALVKLRKEIGDV